MNSQCASAAGKYVESRHGTLHRPVWPQLSPCMGASVEDPDKCIFIRANYQLELHALVQSAGWGRTRLCKVLIGVGHVRPCKLAVGPYTPVQGASLGGTHSCKVLVHAGCPRAKCRFGQDAPVLSAFLWRFVFSSFFFILLCFMIEFGFGNSIPVWYKMSRKTPIL